MEAGEIIDDQTQQQRETTTMRITVMALAAVTAAMLSTQADARPNRHPRVASQNVTQFCDTRYCPVGVQPVGVRIEISLKRERRAARAAPGKARHRTAITPRALADVASGIAGGSVGSSGLIAEARRYLGGNPTGRSSLWCAAFMNLVLERSGHRGTGSNMASSFARYGTPVSGPQVGAIAVMHRGLRGGHVGIVSGIDSNGNPIIISGNHGRRVAESTYSRGRIYAYVMP